MSDDKGLNIYDILMERLREFKADLLDTKKEQISQGKDIEGIKTQVKILVAIIVAVVIAIVTTWIRSK